MDCSLPGSSVYRILQANILEGVPMHFSSGLPAWLRGDVVYGDATVVCRRRQWHPTRVLLPGKSHGWRSLVGCSPWGREEWDTTEWLHFPFSLSCIGEGHGNPLQCSCLENPRAGGAWWAAVCGVAQSRTRLKRLSSSSSSCSLCTSECLLWYPPVLVSGTEFTFSTILQCTLHL